MLLVGNAEWLPKKFALVDMLDETKRLVLVMWATSDALGVKFEGSDAPAPKKPPGFGKRRV